MERGCPLPETDGTVSAPPFPAALDRRAAFCHKATGRPSSSPAADPWGGDTVAGGRILIKINSFIHRKVLDDIIRRWMYGESRPADADLITRLVHFNHVYVSRYLAHFSGLIFRGLHRKDLSFRTVQRKGDLKDALVLDPPCHNERIDELILEYHKNPGRFYRETPFHGTLYFCNPNGGTKYVGSIRIKRVRRLAEKSARRIIDRIFVTIQRHADVLADERARRLGIPRETLLTAPDG
jgi:hypothetical protein